MSEVIYDIKGARGRNIKVFEDKAIITVKAGLGSFLTGNVSDGEKRIAWIINLSSCCKNRENKEYPETLNGKM